MVPQYNTLDRACTVYENIHFHCLYFGFSRVEAKTRTEGLLEQFKAKVQPSKDVRVQLSNLHTQSKDFRSQRHDSDRASLELAQLVVNSVKGDPEEGETSGLYSAMGYVPKNQRRSGLTRKSQSTPPLATASVK